MTTEEQQAAYGHLTANERFSIYRNFEPTWRWVFCWGTYSRRYSSYVDKFKAMGYTVEANHHVVVMPDLDVDLCTFPTPDTMLSWRGGEFVGVPFYDLTTGKNYTNTSGYEWLLVESHEIKKKPLFRLQVQEIG